MGRAGLEIMLEMFVEVGAEHFGQYIRIAFEPQPDVGAIVPTALKIKTL